MRGWRWDRLRPPVMALAALASLAATRVAAPGPSAPAATPEPSSSANGFDALKTLVGEWKGESSGGRTVAVAYRLYSADTVLLETWGTKRPTLTAYHLDGPRLMATHYCAQGNQPRLRLTSAPMVQPFVFELLDATNLADGAAHLRRLEMELGDADHFKKTETYASSAGDETTTYVFTRVKTTP